MMVMFVVTTAAVVGVVEGYIAYCQITNTEIKWGRLKGMAIGHIMAHVLLYALEKSLQ